MKKNILGTTVLAAILTSEALSACSGNPKETTAAATETQAADSRTENTTATEAETTQTSAELKGIMVGTSPAPCAEILNAVKEVLTSRGYELKIVEHTDYVQPNNVPGSGDLDANYFRHGSYLNSFNEQSGTNLVSAGATHYESFGVCAGKAASLEGLPDKAAVLVPDDVNNEARTLLLLEAQGLIRLKDGIGPEATKNDIVGNTEGLDTVESEATQLPHPISGGDIAVTNGNYTIEAGLRVSDTLATEDPQSLAVATYGNVAAVREEEESSGATRALAEALTSPEIKQFMEETYEGAVVPLF